MLASPFEPLMVDVLYYLIYAFLILPSVVLLITAFPIDVIPGPAGFGIGAVLDNVFDVMSITLWSFLDRSLKCNSPRGKFSIMIVEPGFKELGLDRVEARTMHGGLDGKGLCVGK